MRIFPICSAAAALAVMLTAPGGPAAADPIADFYRGRTITVAVPAGAGGSFHLYALLVQRHIGRFIPGNPSAIVQNRPGGGGVSMNNYFAGVAPKDGTMIGEINPGTLALPLLRKMPFDPREFEWLGSVAVRSFVGAVWHTVAADTIEKMQKEEVIFGSSGVGALNYQVPALMNMVLGTRNKIVTGYGGGGNINIALERGEIQARANFYTGFLATNGDWIREGKLKFFFVMGPPIPALPNLPQLKDKVPTLEGRQMVTLVETGIVVGQAFFMPPGTVRQRVEAVRAAFETMVKDRAFLADAEQKKLDILPSGPEEIRQILDEAYRTPPAVAQRLAKAFGMDKEPAGGKNGKKKKQE